MHPSEEIFCERGELMKGKTIVLGITGSIAATECFGTIRELIRHGARVVPVVTPAGARLVSLDALEFASGQRPIVELTGQTEHIALFGEGGADLLLIFPATANTISKIALGIDDTAVTSMAMVAIGKGTPTIVAPAMHKSMLDNRAVSRNLNSLREMGVTILGPYSDGVRAKVASRDEVVEAAIRAISKNDLKGKSILIIGGRSEEPMDGMRVVTNRSSGLMALELAKDAYRRGADVELWMGACNVIIPDHLSTKRFSKVADLIGMVDLIDHDVAIVPAALSDFEMEEAEGKISSDGPISLRMRPAPKVLPLICGRCGFVIGFKAESGNDPDKLEGMARCRMREYGLGAMVANDISSAGAGRSSALILTNGSTEAFEGPKSALASRILDIVVG